MSLWEYKVISSGKGGFATPALLEKFLNDLGRDEWEIIEFRAQPDNALAFSGLARRSTQRDWTLEDAAAAAAKVEAEKLRAEFEAKFKAATTTTGTEERAPSLIEEKAAPDDGFRKPVDTSRDDDPEADDEKDDWDKLTAAEEDELPTFFEAIKPHMRRNQRGPGQSVGVDYLAKKWDQSEDDLKAALAECGFDVPEDEDSKVVHVEYDGDLYWLNVNRRGELWINTKEKPRPIFKAVKAQRITIEEEPKPEGGGQKFEGGNRRPDRPERQERPEQSERTPQDTRAEGDAPAGGQSAPRQQQSGSQPSAPLPPGAQLLERIRPLMRRNRRGPGGSGSATFLARALKTNENDIKEAFVALGLIMPAGPNDKAVYTEIGDAMWWLNLDSRGGLWINGREKREGETAHSAAASDHAEAPVESAPGSAAPDAERAPAAEVAASSDSAPHTEPHAEPPAGSSNPVLAGIRPHLKETRTGSLSGRVDQLAQELGRSVEELTASLEGAGLKVPEKAREKPVYAENGGEAFWLTKNAKGELWLNTKVSKFADKKSDRGDAATGSPSGDADASETARPTSESAKDSAEGPADTAEKKPRSRLNRGGRGRKKSD